MIIQYDFNPFNKKMYFCDIIFIHQVEEETQIWNDANLKVSGILERRERDNIEDQVSSNTQENGAIGIQQWGEK